MDEIPVAAGDNRPPKAAVERFTLGKIEAERVAGWIKQLEESSKGFLQLSRSDVVNFILREHKAELSPRELQQIRSQHYDPVRHLTWITPRLKEAIKNNDTEMVAALQSEIRGIELSVVSRALETSNGSPEMFRPPRRRKRKLKSELPPDPDTSFKEIPGEISEG